MHDGRHESQQRRVEHIITEETIRGCRPNEKDTIQANLKVPPIPPTDFSTSSVVKVKYLINVR